MRQKQTRQMSLFSVTARHDIGQCESTLDFDPGSAPIMTHPCRESAILYLAGGSILHSDSHRGDPGSQTSRTCTACA